MKSISRITKNINRTTIIGFLTILVLLWLVLYFIPDIFISLFNSLLGNIILITTAVLVLMYNMKYGIILSIVFILLYRFAQLSKKEGFSWDPKSTQDFILLQSTINPQKIFDVNMIQNSQASQEEVDYFNKHGEWPWSQKTKELYIEALNTNPYIRTWAPDGVKYAMTVYNEAAILRILSYQTKEGQFLLNGVLVKDPLKPNKAEELPNGFGDYPYSSGLMEDKTADIIKCNMKDPNNAKLERITYTGKGGIYGEQNSKVSPVDDTDLEKMIPGFTFVNKQCNPCGAINETPDYSCPFKLNVKNKPSFISNVWQYLWNINDNPLESVPSFLSENINSDKFPILSELQNELKKQTTY